MRLNIIFSPLSASSLKILLMLQVFKESFYYVGGNSAKKKSINYSGSHVTCSFPIRDSSVNRPVERKGFHLLLTRIHSTQQQFNLTSCMWCAIKMIEQFFICFKELQSIFTYFLVLQYVE